MTEHQFRLHDSKGGSALAIRVTPRARRNELVEVQSNGTLRVRLTASASENQTNEALIRFLAKILDISPAQIEVVAGETGRDKLVTIFDLDAETVHDRILKHL